MLTVEQALALVAQHASPLASRRLPLGEVAGLVLATDITSDIDSPPHDKALMDGYAVVSSDREPQRRVIEEIAAGAVPQLTVIHGTASRIMTGAPLPDGADAVVAIEQTELVGPDTVRLAQLDPAPGQHILRRGASLRVGDTVLRAGALIRPIEIGVLAELGHGDVDAYPRPRVAILPTGNELVPVSEQPASGQIRNSNGPMLAAAAQRAGAEAIELEIARDNRDQLTARIAQGLTADVLLLSGGVSAGKFDLVPPVLASLGVQTVFHKVALRPGKPLWFGIQEDGSHRTLVFGLPGNPVSSFVCFELFARPAITALAGRGFIDPPVLRASLLHPYDHAGGRAACLPARFRPASPPDERATVEILPWQGSADLAALTHATALVRLPAEKIQLPAGTLVDVHLI
jgi:molybdopterin molybdotransferase